MQLIIFSKNSANSSVPELIDYDPAARFSIPGECTQKGTICLISASANESLKNIFTKQGYYDCGEKAKKIDLKRALKFDEKKNRNSPKKVIFNS
jgi:hypothetical protein